MRIWPLPADWRWSTIGDVVTVEKRLLQPHEMDGGVQYVGLDNIERDTGRLINYGNQADQGAKSSKFQFDEHTLLYGKLRPYLNKVHMPDFQGHCSTDILVLRPNQSVVNRRYLGAWMRHPSFVAEANVRSTGANLPRINPSVLCEISVPLPPLDTQRKIVAILDKVEETRRLRAQANELTQTLLQSVFLEMFGDPVRNPKGWNRVELDKLCINICGGGTPSKAKTDYYQGKIPWVTSKDVKQDFIHDSIDHITEDAIAQSTTKLIPPESLIMVIRSGILKKCLPVAINTAEVTINQDLKAFTFNRSLVEPSYMLYYFKLYQRALLNRVRAVTADNIDFNEIRGLEIMLPPIESQRYFSAIVQSQQNLYSRQRLEESHMARVMSAIMAKAFTGELVA